MSGPLVVAYDTETRGFDWWDPQEQAFLGSWAHRTTYGELKSGTNVLGDPDHDGQHTFVKLIAGADVQVGHNLTFDIHQTRETTGWNPRSTGAELHDTDLMARIVVPERGNYGLENPGFGLKALATALIDPEAGKYEEKIEERMKELKIKKSDPASYYQVWRAYPADMEEYARMDAVYTLLLYERFKPMLTGRPAEVYALEMRLEPTIATAEKTGLRIDQGAVERLRGEYEPESERLRASLVEALGDVLEGEGSRDGLRDALVEHGIPLHRKTEKTGILRTDKFALQEFEDDFPVIANLMEWRRVSKFITTYLDPMSKAQPDLHTSFFQCEARTGRMSSRRPNLQNLPKAAGKEVRSPIVPRPGCVFVACDYEGIEARLLAYYLGDEGYKDLFRKGRDPHAWMASKIHGGTPSDFAKGGPKDDERSEAKNVLFAITYGAGARRVSDMLKIEREDAKALVSTIKSALPGYRKLMARAQKKIRTTGYVETVMGRQQYVPKDKAYVGLNALIQGSAADIMKRGTVAANAAVGVAGTPVLFVHDEVVVECSEEFAEDVKDRVERAMVGAWDLDPLLAVESKIVRTNYADA